MRQPREIRTSRLLLRPFRAQDATAVHAYASDAETTRYMDWGPNRPRDTVRFIELAMRHAEEPDARAWEFAVTAADGTLLGGAGIHVLGTHRAEIGYCFGRWAWGHGYATEAAAALVRIGFETLGVHRVEARCDPANARSARVLTKLGMQLEGRVRESVHVRGAWVDRLLYAVLEQEWQSGER